MNGSPGSLRFSSSQPNFFPKCVSASKHCNLCFCFRARETSIHWDSFSYRDWVYNSFYVLRRICMLFYERAILCQCQVGEKLWDGKNVVCVIFVK